MEGLGIDIKLLIAQIINFLLLFLIFKKTVSQSFLEFLSKNEQQGKEKEQLLKELEEKEIKAKEEEKKIFEKAQAQGLQIVEDAKKNATQIKAEILKQGHKEAEEIKEKMSKELEREKSNIYKETKTKIVETCIIMIKSVLSKFITEEKQTEAIKYLLKELEKDKSYGL